MIDYGLLSAFYEGLTPELRVTVNEWADQKRILTSHASAEAGNYRTSRTPYVREWGDMLSSGNVCQKVILMKGAQIAATEQAFNFLGYSIDIAPGPFMYVLPTVELCKRNSKTRLAPMIDSTPTLRNKIGTAKSKDSTQTLLQKDFPGAPVVFAGANSAATLRNMPVRYLVLDEPDAYPRDLGGEGSPLLLAEKRTATFPNRKIFMLSSPTIAGQSVIEREFKKTDQRYYFVPCPDCGATQTLVFKNLIWEPGKPETARYKCEHCEVLIEERHKTRMLAAGKWVATVPENSNPIIVGYHLNSLYSPFGWYSWEKAAYDFENAKMDVNEMKTFVNTVLAETWKEKGDAPPWENIYNRREDYNFKSVNKEVIIITCGVDIQADRIELEIVGWGKRKTSYSIDYRVLLGDTSKTEVWLQLSVVLSELFVREDGIKLPILMMAIDSGFNTSYVYDFCRRYDYSRVIPVKGQERIGMMVSTPRSVDTMRGGKKLNTVKLWNVDTSMIKSEIYGNLKLEQNEDDTYPGGYCHFPQYDRHYFKGLTAEVLRSKTDKKGHTSYEWHKTYERNEPLDCRVYARAAAYVIGIDNFQDQHWDIFEQRYNPESQQKQIVKTPPRSSHWDR